MEIIFFVLRFLLCSFFATLLPILTFGSVSIEIDLQEQRAYLLRNRRVILETPISTGRAGHRTPTGKFKITEKDHDHLSSEYGRIVDEQGRTVVADADAEMTLPPGGRFVPAPMPYFLRFTGGIGMHAGILPGYPASHGCVRLPKEKARAFYEAVEIGTPVTVFGITRTPPRQESRVYQARKAPSRNDEDEPVYERRTYLRNFFDRW